MIECPWCLSRVVLSNDVCPECRQEVLPEHMSEMLDKTDLEWREDIEEYGDQHDGGYMEQAFKCVKCGYEECEKNEAAMTGTGISKILDINYQHYLFVSCLGCGFVEIYNPNILRRR